MRSTARRVIVVSVLTLALAAMGTAAIATNIEETDYTAGLCIGEQRVGTDYTIWGPIALSWGGKTYANVYSSSTTCDGDNQWWGKVDDIRTDGSCVDTYILDNGWNWREARSCSSPVSVVHVDNDDQSWMQTCLEEWAVCNPFRINLDY